MLLNEIYAGIGDSIRQNTLQDSNLGHVLDLTRSDSKIVQKIGQVRSIIDPQQRQDAKSALLPYFVLNKFRGNIRKNENFEEALFLVADFDHVTPSSLLEEICSKLKLDERVVAFFRSPSYDGVKIIFSLSQPITNKEFFSKYYTEVITSISLEYGVKPDLSCKDPARAVFFSHDPDLFISEEPRPLQVILPKTSDGSLKGRPPKQETFSTSSRFMEMFGPAAPGDRTRQLTQFIGLCIDKGFSSDFTLAMAKTLNSKNTPPHLDSKVESMVKDMYARYTRNVLPFDIIDKGNQYFRFSFTEQETKEKLLTTFSIEPKELLRASEGDVLHCTVHSSKGSKYEDVLLETGDWTSENLNSAISHMDCTVIATDMEVKVLKMYIDNRIPVIKHGTKVVGMDESRTLWAVKNCNISKDGVLASMTTIPYDKGGDAFYNKVEYLFQDEETFLANARKFYDLILKINDPQAIVPFIGWNFIAPVRGVIMDYKEKFPVLFVPGSMGSGKTSTAKLFMKLHGYKSPDVQSADMRRFPMLKALSSTNGIPVFIDEFKQSDMTDFSTNDIHRYIRKSFDGGVEPKGHSDQTTTDYHLYAPWVLIGEWSIKTPAERERMIIPRFSSQIKHDVNMQAAFKELFENTELRGFMPKYIQFLLNQNIRKRYDDAESYCVKHFGGLSAAPRVLHNLVVMVVGINLFMDFGESLGFQKPEISLPAILNGQLAEITGTSTGQVESAMDQLMGELSAMSIRERRDTSGLATGNTREPWFEVIDHQGRAALAIRFSLALPMLKEFAKRTSSDIDILDASGYKRMMKPQEVKYFISANQPVRFAGRVYRCLVLDMEKMKSAGIDIEGFEQQ